MFDLLELEFGKENGGKLAHKSNKGRSHVRKHAYGNQFLQFNGEGNTATGQKNTTPGLREL